MDDLSPGADDQPSRFGYVVAIVLSALGHAAAIALVFFVLPAYLHGTNAPLPAYSVKIVDQLPAGDLGTHLPKLSSRKEASKPEVKPPQPQAPKVVPQPPRLAREPDMNAIALNTIHSPTPAPPQAAPTPTPTPEPTRQPTQVVTPEPTPQPTPAPTQEPKAKATAKPKTTAKPQAKPTPNRTERKKHEPKPPVEIAKVEHKASVEEQLSRLREQLMTEHLKQEKNRPPQEQGEEETGSESEAAPSGGGPVVANRAIEGKGAGIGPGSGSAGIQQDPEFLLYYRTVQEKVKKAWNFTAGSSDLSTTVTFAIGPDGNLTGVRVTQNSRDSAFDDSVVRAIRHAAPFPAPPEKYRSQFAQGIEAVFRLGELSS